MSKKQLTTGIAIGAAFVVLIIFFGFVGLPQTNEEATTMRAQEATTQLSDDTQTTHLLTQDVTVGKGVEAQAGDTLKVHYTGRLSDGTVFDTSVGGEPFTFILGARQVIPGWEQGFEGMKVGGKRILVIPPNLAYGSQGVGPIPPNATLTFQVELLSITPKK